MDDEQRRNRPDRDHHLICTDTGIGGDQLAQCWFAQMIAIREDHAAQIKLEVMESLIGNARFGEVVTDVAVTHLFGRFDLDWHSAVFHAPIMTGKREESKTRRKIKVKPSKPKV